MWFLWLVMSAAVLAQAPASARIWIGHEAQIEALAAWYREGGVSGRFELVPGL